ncbi:hypothetical protein PLICRDRAFT_33783 [Plicaturopsis crispa FD-325 SS-3]|nr:hypothetical protein PLICRDRAFT_33783 [Plicaturopsis crispa FD-325 SS-3]
MSNAAEPSLPEPFEDSASEEIQDKWNDDVDAFTRHIILFRLSPLTTAQELFKLFDDPKHRPLLYYYACHHLIHNTHQFSESAPYIALIAELISLLKEEGLSRDDEDGLYKFANGVIFDSLRAQLGEIPVPPGCHLNPTGDALVAETDYIPDESYTSSLAEYGRQHQAQLRLWSLVGRLEGGEILGVPGGLSLLFHSGEQLLHALDNPVNQFKYETLWAAIPNDAEDMANDKWGAHDADQLQRLKAFKSALTLIVRSDKAPLVHRARLAIILDELSKAE